jgi:hypothetical protein
MSHTITLAANETATLTAKEANASGVYSEITLGQYSHLLVDGAEVSFKHITLERLGSRIIELSNGAQLHVGALGFASMGASITYRIGAGCALTFDASQWDPEVVANTTFDFASQGSGTLKYFPFINPDPRGLNRRAGCAPAPWVYSCDKDDSAARARSSKAPDSSCAPAGAVATATPSIIAA